MQIDPTYLRAIRDGLHKENIQKDNLNSLPDGVVGLLDKELFPPSMNIDEKKKILEFFIPFAITQKEISIEFALSILGKNWSVEKFEYFFTKYVKRFSTAGDNKYRLYHDRFKVYIMQRVGEKTLSTINLKLIQLISSNLKSDQNEEIRNYGLAHLLTHYNFQSLYDSGFREDIIQLLQDNDFSALQVSNNLSLSDLEEGFHLSANLASRTEDWVLLKQITKSITYFSKLKDEQISKDLLNIEIGWDTLYSYFNEKNDNSEKVRFFFRICILDRDFTDPLFLKMSEKLVEIVNEEYIDLSETAPCWLVDKVKKMAKKVTVLKEFFEEADDSEMVKITDLEPELVCVTENFKDYSREYKQDFERILKILKKDDDLTTADFENLFNSINESNLISKDEILARITDELLCNFPAKPLTLKWFLWLITESNFEKGYHSQDNINTCELGLRFIQKCSIENLEILYNHINKINVDYFSRIKIANHISEKYHYFKLKDKAERILCIIKNEETKFEASPWIKNWILRNNSKRLKYINLLNSHHRLEVLYANFIIVVNINIENYLQSELSLEIEKLDKVSKTEYLAEFATKFKKIDPVLSQYLIEKGWTLIQKTKDWAEHLAKLAVFSSSLEIMSSEWIESAFNLLKKDLKKYEDEDECYSYISETLLTTSKNRFGNTGKFNLIQQKFKKIDSYLKTNYDDLYEDAQLKADFLEMMENKLNNYKSIREFWKKEKKYFKKSGPGEYFHGFWNYFTSQTSIFSDFNAEDFRIINTIANKVNERFPFERFLTLNTKIVYYSDRFVIPDVFQLGLNEGIKSMVLLRNNLTQSIVSEDNTVRKNLYEEDCSTILYASFDAISKRVEQYDFMKEEIQPFAYALIKSYSFVNNIFLLDSYLSLKERLRAIELAE